MIKNNFLLLTLCLFLFTGCITKSYVYNTVDSEEACSLKGGYWYNGKCWKTFEDESIAPEEVDDYVESAMAEIEGAGIMINGVKRPFAFLEPHFSDEGMVIIIAVYQIDEQTNSLLIPIAQTKQIKGGTKIEADVQFFPDNIFDMPDEIEPVAGEGQVDIIGNIDNDDFRLRVEGSIPAHGDKENMEFSFDFSKAAIGAGDSSLVIEDGKAYLSGILGTKTYRQIQNLIKNNPEVKTIVFTEIEGSVNDAINMHTGRLIRKHGYTTRLLADSDIASGGVDLFCAGKERIVERGAMIGVHSWCCVQERRRKASRRIIPRINIKKNTFR